MEGPIRKVVPINAFVKVAIIMVSKLLFRLIQHISRVLVIDYLENYAWVVDIHH